MTTDVMVGFAGETEEDFNASLNFVKSIGFAKVHIFPYSRRKGTVADKAPNQIDPQIKEQRAKIMEQVCDETRREFLKEQVGLCESVLVEILRVTQRTTRLFILIPKIQVSVVKLLM